ncbi:ran GTP-binding protein [Schizosaccharomyces cryophilus OY26]|uniref:Ran GTP-binding protein n=1 Tax=Schizosaccharomyces cryophilus (strain OY26 / ATCC MYA-4695 / CBS 11777 / NBRC 106824 / NRRL Y48691) TaxID=653667 RepID=S9X2M3_SCHCR|nr:ran GTP-binding protein [Schizosaccharomyces cryophilus OY26]EPY51322.1 ran GTP-binding protein [Schizosaccharomyces cryophilus OY26]
MDELFHVASHAATFATSFAIKHSISFAGKFAVQQVSSYIKRIPDADRNELEFMKAKLLEMIRVVTPAIELIDIMSSSGNQSLQSTRQLVDALRSDIEKFSVHILGVASSDSGEEASNPKRAEETKGKVLQEIKTLLLRIQDAIPLLNLSITTSGLSISSSLPKSTNFSQLFKANSFVLHSNLSFTGEKPLQVGPTFRLRTYKIFESHAQSKFLNHDSIIWQEDCSVCVAKVFRVPPQQSHNKNSLLSYKLSLVQSFDDNRYHEEDEVPMTKDILLSTIQTLFYSVSGKLLRLDEVTTPVILLKYKDNPSETSEEQEAYKWIAMELLPEEEFESEEDDNESQDSDNTTEEFSDEHMAEMQLLGLTQKDLVTRRKKMKAYQKEDTNLVLLEYLLRLCALEANAQESVLQLPDEQISLYLRDDQGRERPRDPGSYHALENTGDARVSPTSATSSRRSGVRASSTFLSPWVKQEPSSPLKHVSRNKILDERETTSGYASPLMNRKIKEPSRREDMIGAYSPMFLRSRKDLFPEIDQMPSSKKELFASEKKNSRYCNKYERGS